MTSTSKCASTAHASPSRDNLIRFPAPKPRLRPGVPPFDPGNPVHLRAWEALFDLGMAGKGRG
mgnify:CR=1 FL=1